MSDATQIIDEYDEEQLEEIEPGVDLDRLVAMWLGGRVDTYLPYDHETEKTGWVFPDGWKHRHHSDPERPPPFSTTDNYIGRMVCAMKDIQDDELDLETEGAAVVFGYSRKFDGWYCAGYGGVSADGQSLEHAASRCAVLMYKRGYMPGGVE